MWFKDAEMVREIVFQTHLENKVQIKRLKRAKEKIK